MPRICTLLALLCAITPSAFATLFYGTITQTVTETNDPEYAVGNVFTSTFHYESTQRDGTFYGLGSYMPPEAFPSLATLDGNLFFPLPMTEQAGWETPYHLPPFGGYHNYTTGAASYITVSGGLVTDFLFVRDPGPFILYFTTTTFGAVVHDRYGVDADGNFTGWLDNMTTRGTMSFSAVNSVPEGAPTIGLLLGGALLVGLCRRKH